MNATPHSKRTSREGVDPIWIRLPLPGELEPRSSLRRGVLMRLIGEGKIISVTTQDEGKERGCRLILLESLLSYLDGLVQQQNFR
jgi:hypothetical protein